MQSLKSKALLVLVLFIAIGCKERRTGIAIVGLDSKGKPMDFFVDPKQYSDKLGELLSSVSDSTMPVLQDLPESKKWGLRTVLVGLGLNMEAGIEPILKVSASPKLKVVFSNSKKPSIP